MRSGVGPTPMRFFKSLELSSITRHVHGLLAQNPIEQQTYDDRNVTGKISDFIKIISSYN